MRSGVWIAREDPLTTEKDKPAAAINNIVKPMNILNRIVVTPFLMMRLKSKNVGGNPAFPTLS
jgi:hypothetical protein